MLRDEEVRRSITSYKPTCTTSTVKTVESTGVCVRLRSPVIERLMFRDSQVALKHVIHDMETRTLVRELRRRAIKKWVNFVDMDRRLKIPHQPRLNADFGPLPRNAYTIAI